MECPLAAAAEAASHSSQQPSREDATAAGANAATDDHTGAAQAGAGQAEPPAHTALDMQVTRNSASPHSRCALVARRPHGACAVVSQHGRQLRVWRDCPQAAQPAQLAHPQLLVEPGGGVSDDEEEDVEAVASKAHRVSPLSCLVPAVVPAHLGCLCRSSCVSHLVAMSDTQAARNMHL